MDLYIFWGKFIVIAIGLSLFPDKVAVKEMAKAAEQGLSNTFIAYYVLSIPLKLLGFRREVQLLQSILYLFILSQFMLTTFRLVE